MNISVVIPTYNRPEGLKNCLTSLSKQELAPDEIVVVDDNSSTDTKSITKLFPQLQIKLISLEKNLGASVARNTGITATKNSIVAMIDDDCLASPQWLKNLTAAFTDAQISWVIGQTYYKSENYKGHFPERLVRNLGANWPMSGNLAIRKEAFATIGLFDTKFFQFNNEDTEFGIKAVANNLQYAKAINAIVFHQEATWNTSSLLKSAKNAAIWPSLKKMYPDDYLHFQPKIMFGFIVNPLDYPLLLLSPVIIPLLLIRYILNGKKDLKIFFTKWPVLLILRRYFIWREALKNKVFMI